MIVYVQQVAGVKPWIFNVGSDHVDEARAAVIESTPDTLRRVFALIEGGGA